jgi:sulfotransferase family protein
MNPYVFFVGCPRSGTTLVKRIGNAHPQLAVAREQHWLPHFWRRGIGITPDGTVTEELVTTLLGNRRFLSLGIAPERLEIFEDGRPKHYARFVTEIFDLYGEINRKPCVGEKTPAYVRWLPTLHWLWPHAKYVHIIRDGRDVALSVLEWGRAERIVGRFPTWEEDRAVTAALHWEWNVRLGREGGAGLGPERYHELRYEALVADAETECQKLCDFLALAYDPSMLSFHEGRTRSKPGLSAKKAWRPVTAGLRDWREQMLAGDLRRFEAAAGPLLDELGYDRAFGSGHDDEVERAAQLRGRFVEELRAHRYAAVPEAWERVAA